MRVFSILDQIQWFEHVAGITADERQESDQSRQHEDVIVRQIQLSNDVVNGQLGFGLPPGTDAEPLKDNIHGVWVRAEFIAKDTPTEIIHNLNLPLVDGTILSTAFIPNVRWINFMVAHDGTGAGPACMISLVYEIGDEITPNSIELRVFCSAPRTVNADHPIYVDLFFIPAEQ